MKTGTLRFLLIFQGKGKNLSAKSIAKAGRIQYNKINMHHNPQDTREICGRKGGAHLVNQRSILIQAAIKAVRLYGLDGVRMQHIGQIAHTTPSSIYQYFKGKEDLFRVCYEQIDYEIAHVLCQVDDAAQELDTDTEKAVYTLWSSFWKWLVEHPDETIFYHYYRDWSGFPEYDKNRDVSHFNSFVQAVHRLYDRYPGFNAVPPILLWLFWLDGTIMYARYVALGMFPNTPETESAVFHLVMSGVGGLMNPK